MWSVAVLLVLPTLAACSGEGNIRLLEEDVATALKACTNKDKNSSRQRRSDDYGSDDPYSKTRIDSNSKQDSNQYGHERRNTSDLKDQIYVLNATDYDYAGFGNGNAGEKYLNTVPRPAISGGNNTNETVSVNRTRRSEPLLTNDGSDQCLSQCVFANLQVVDSRGIPRETELWNKVMGSVNSQQSRAALHDQIRACFQELQSEAEDNGCSYSNKLERCLMLRFEDRTSQDENKDNQKT